jgi:enamine deaminase RidA (YjgF/YER057c/UK114 family)
MLMNPPGLYDPTPHAYSHVAVIGPRTRLVFVAGQGGERENGELSSEFRVQVRQALDNLAIALAAASAEMRAVAKMTMLVVDHTEEKLQVIQSELERVLDGRPAPTCTLIPVPRLALDRMLVEVDAVAVLPA